MSKPSISIERAMTEDDIAAVARLFEAYQSSLDVDLCFQDFASELAGLPGKYAPPAGTLLLARDGTGAAVGCVALRPLPADGACEMKRLYVAPEGRGLGLGKALLGAVLADARRIGYREILLDTLPMMTAAQALYRGAGFAQVQAYYDTPVAGTLFMRLSLIG